MLKKCCAVFLMLVLFIYPVSASEGETSDYASFDQNIRLLYNLGVFDESVDLQPESEVTRGQLVMLLVQMLGLPSGVGMENVFDDVTAEHPYFYYISAANALKIVNGFEDNTFRPDEKVSYFQALKMIVTVLGYSERAESLGGFPSGYYQQAAQLKITLPYAIDGNAPLKFATLAEIITESLEVDLAQILNTDEERQKYTIQKGKNILSEYYSIYKHKGVITANYYTALEGQETANSDLVALDGVLYYKGDTNADEYLGQNVTVYAYEDEDGSEGIIKAIVPKTDGPSVTISADDLVGTPTEGKITYDTPEGKQESITFDSNAVVVFNGKKTEQPKAAYFDIEMGSIRAVDPDGNGYSLFFVDSYENYIVDAVDSNKDIIYFKDGAEPLVLNTNDTSKRVIFTDQNGYEAYVSETIEWDVISVFQSEDKKTVRAVRSDKMAAGMVESVSDDRITIDGKEYKLSPGLRKSETFTPPRAGVNAEFLLDFSGNIAYVNTESYRESKYGYLVGIDSVGGISESVRLKIFTEYGEMKIFETEDELVFNGKKIKGSELFTGSGNPLFQTDGSFAEQAVMYRVNKSDKLKELDTAADGSNMDPAARLDEFTLDYTGESEKMVGYDTVMFGTRYLPRSETKIFVVPEKYEGNDKSYSVIAYTGLRHYSEETYKLAYFYDITEDNVISMMVLRDAATESISLLAESAVVKDRRRGLNSEGEVVDLVTLYNSKGNEISVYADDDFMVEAGDATITDLRTETEVNITERIDEPGNLLTNGKFELVDENNNALGWIAWPETPIPVVPVREDGSNALEMTYSGNLTVGQKVSITPGEEYELSYWMYMVPGSTTYGAVKLQFDTPAGYNVTYDVQYEHKNEQRGVWKQFKQTFVAKDDAVVVNVIPRSYNPGTIYFDDIVLKSTSWQPSEGEDDSVIKTFKEKIPFSALMPGDVVQYETLTSGKVTAMKVLFRANAAKAETVLPRERSSHPTTPTWDYNDLLYIFAEVDARTKYGIRVFVPYGNDEANPLVERMHLFNKAKVLLFQERGGASGKPVLKPITSRDILKGDKVFALRSSSTQKFIIVYR